MGFETSKNEAGEKSKLTPEQQKSVDVNRNKAKALFDALEEGGGQPEIQEAKLNVKDLTEKLEMFEKDPRTNNDMETIKWYKREIELNQRVANGESLVKVLDSMKSKEDEERIKEVRKRLSEMKQL